MLDGCNVNDLETSWFRRQLGVVSQEPVLFSSTIRENIRHGLPEATDDQIEQAARQANAYDFIEKLPKVRKYHILLLISPSKGRGVVKLDWFYLCPINHK